MKLRESKKKKKKKMGLIEKNKMHDENRAPGSFFFVFLESRSFGPSHPARLDNKIFPSGSSSSFASSCFKKRQREREGERDRRFPYYIPRGRERKKEGERWRENNRRKRGRG